MANVLKISRQAVNLLSVKGFHTKAVLAHWVISFIDFQSEQFFVSLMAPSIVIFLANLEGLGERYNLTQSDQSDDTHSVMSLCLGK